MSETDIKNLLLEKLKFYYDGFIHSIVDLSMREVTGDKGSLCGMSALYQAAQQTILTVSQIQQMSFDDVKARVGETLGLDSVNVKKENDVDLIEDFYICEFELRLVFLIYYLSSSVLWQRTHHYHHHYNGGPGPRCSSSSSFTIELCQSESI